MTEHAERAALRPPVDRLLGGGRRRELRRWLETEIERGGPIRLDLSSIRRADRRGLGVIVAGFRRAKERGVRLEVAAVSPELALLFELTGIDLLIAAFEKEEGPC